MLVDYLKWPSVEPNYYGMYIKTLPQSTHDVHNYLQEEVQVLLPSYRGFVVELRDQDQNAIPNQEQQSTLSLSTLQRRFVASAPTSKHLAQILPFLRLISVLHFPLLLHRDFGIFHR